MTQFLFKRSGTADKRPDPAQMALGEVDLNYDDITGGLFYKNSSGGVVKVGPAQVSAGAPNATPAGSAGNALGEFWYDTGSSALCIWDGSAWQATGGGGGIPASTFTECGELIVGTGAGTYAALPLPKDAFSNVISGQLLFSCATEANGMAWAAPTFLSSTALTSNSVGAIPVNACNLGDGVCFASVIPGGKTGQILCYAYDSGNAAFLAAQGYVNWCDPNFVTQSDFTTGALAVGNTPATTGGAGSIDTLTNVNNPGCGPGYYTNVVVLTNTGSGSGALANVNIINTGYTNSFDYVEISQPGTGYAVGDSVGFEIDGTTLTTEGLIASLNPTTICNVGYLTVGADGEVLTADSTCALGVKWAAGGGGGSSIPCSAFTAVGELLAGTGAGTYSALTVGANGTYLVADSACSEGIKWNALPTATPSVLGLVYGRSVCGSVPYADTWDIAAFGLCATNGAVIGAGAGFNFAGATAFGNCAMAVNAANTASVAVGTCAAYSGAGFGSVVIGHLAGCSGTGDSTIAIGACASRALSGGSSNVVIGNTTAACAASGSVCNTFIGSQGPFNGFPRVSASSNRNIAIGHQALCRMGQEASCNTDNNIAIGSCSMWQVSGGDNISIGVNSGCAITTGCGNIAIGHLVQVASATGNCQLAIGNGSSCWLSGDSTFAIKPGAGIIDCAGSCGTAGQVLMSDGANAICWGSAGGGGIPTSAITGKGALITGTAASTVASLSVGSDGQVLVACAACGTGLVWAPNTAGTVSAATPTAQGIVYGKFDCGTAYPDTAWDYVAYGFQAGAVLNQFNTSLGVTALGNYAMQCNTSACQTAVGWCAAYCSTQEDCGVAIGYNAGAFSCGFRVAGILGQNTYVGSFSGGNSVGSRNTVLGAGTGRYIIGDENTYLGALSGPYFTASCTGVVMCGNVGVGVNAAASLGQTASATPICNTFVGKSAGNTATNTDFGTALGAGAGAGSTGNANTSVGYRAGEVLTTGGNNIIIGCLAGTTTGGVSGALTTQANRIVMGNSAHTCAQIQIAWTTTSDVRDKALDPSGVPYGLLFVEQLEPIAYRWCNRETNEVTDERLRYGFSAQNIRSLEGDEAVIVSDDNPDKLMITDQHLLPVLVNAIKELSAKNRLLEERIAALEDKA